MLLTAALVLRHGLIMMCGNLSHGKVPPASWESVRRLSKKSWDLLLATLSAEDLKHRRAQPVTSGGAVAMETNTVATAGAVPLGLGAGYVAPPMDAAAPAALSTSGASDAIGSGSAARVSLLGDGSFRVDANSTKRRRAGLILQILRISMIRSHL